MVRAKRQGEVINMTYTCVCVHGLPYMDFICLIPTFGWTSLERMACFILVMMMDDSLGTLLIWFVSPGARSTEKVVSRKVPAFYQYTASLPG